MIWIPLYTNMHNVRISSSRLNRKDGGDMFNRNVGNHLRGSNLEACNEGCHCLPSPAVSPYKSQRVGNVLWRQMAADHSPLSPSCYLYKRKSAWAVLGFNFNHAHVPQRGRVDEKSGGITRRQKTDIFILTAVKTSNYIIEEWSRWGRGRRKEGVEGEEKKIVQTLKNRELEIEEEKKSDIRNK